LQRLGFHWIAVRLSARSRIVFRAIITVFMAVT
jgi:hypothetical protein